MSSGVALLAAVALLLSVNVAPERAAETSVQRLARSDDPGVVQGPADSSDVSRSATEEQDRKSLRAAYISERQKSAGDRYAIETAPRDSAAHVLNARQRLRVEFADKSLLATGIAPTATWSFELQLTGIGRVGSVLGVPPSRQPARTERNRVAYTRGSLIEEWYLNGPLGIEQGFTLNRRIDGGEPGTNSPIQELVIEQTVGKTLTPTLSDDGDVVVFHDGDGRKRVRYAELFAYDAKGKVLASRMEVSGQAIRLVIDDRSATYPIVIDPLILGERTRVIPSESENSARFGRAIAVNLDTAVVGARDLNGPDLDLDGRDDRDFGAAYVFVREENGWVLQQRLHPIVDYELQEFGASVGISGDTIVVGATGEAVPDGTAGAVFVFRPNGDGVWQQEQRIQPADLEDGDDFGVSVDIWGQTMLVGAYHRDDNAGIVYVFTWDGDNWQQQATLTADDRAADDRFGRSVSLCANTAVVGADGVDLPGADLSGAAYVFERTGTTWSQRQKLLEREEDDSVPQSSDGLVV